VDRLFDVAIIGSGIVGCAVFRECVLAGLSAVLIERGPDILDGASKANSAILHTGFDSKPNSLEHRLIQDGHRAYHAIHERLGLSLLRTGATLVAWNDTDLARLDSIAETAQINGVPPERLSADAIRATEPQLATSARGGLFIRDESLIDPWSAPLAYARQGIANGGVVLRNTNITGGTSDKGFWALQTSGAPIHARTTINCAGLQGDVVEAIARPRPFPIARRRGQFLVSTKVRMI